MNWAYRVWVRAATRVSREWFAALNRPYLAFGEGKAAEDAAYRVALAEEALRDDSMGLAVTTVGDLEKGFEKVFHAKVAEAAKRHGYPMGMLRLAVSMYRS